ncbi:WG repeat-containing protein [Reichenbachiella sp. MALMAid0571]|uniref:WG repeat-containing protein n=1 Tax=Reichenbachiella sp. MALMAid0571 TaxID=3143939 RepID=UPI0032DE8DD4
MNRFTEYLRNFILLFFFCAFFCSLELKAQTDPKVFKENNLSGVKDSNGEVLVPAEYEQLGWSDSLDMFVDNVIGYYDNNWGIITAKNKVITSPDYYELRPVHKDLIIASKKGAYSNHLYYGALNSKGNAVVDFKYSSIDKIANTLIVTEIKDGKTNYGLLNEKNQFLLKTEYSKISHFANDLYVFYDYDFRAGIINKNGQIVVPVSLDSIGYIRDGKAQIFESGKAGLIDESGNLLLKPSFKNISVDGDRAQVLEFNEHTIVDKLNTKDRQFNCDSLVNISDSFYAIYLNKYLTIADRNFNKLISGNDIVIRQCIDDKVVFSKGKNFGVLNEKGEYFIALEYDSISADDGYFYLMENGKWSVANQFGRNITKYKYDDIKPESESLIAVKRRGFWGFIDFQGDEVIANKFDSVTSFKYLTSKVSFLDGFGTINQFGEWICEPVYDEIIIHKEGITEARLKSRIDLVNHDGNVIFQTYNTLKPYDGGFIETTEEGKTGFVMRDGRIVKQPIFDEISFTSQDSILIAREQDYLSLATKDGDRFYSLSGRFEEVLGISEEFVGIRLDGKYGFVDLQGRLRVANRYDSIRLFSDGMAAFYLRGNWGYIDKEENLRVQPVYESSFDYINGTAIVIENGKYGVIDKDGKYLLDSKYDHISRNDFGSFHITLDGKYGLYDSSVKKITSPDYNEVLEVAKGQVVVKRRGMFGVMNEQGRFTIPMVYSNITYLSQGKYMVVEVMNAPKDVKLK